MDFEQELAALINRASIENESNTPDFILAQYLKGVLEQFNAAVRARETWYGRNPNIGPAGIIIDPSKGDIIENSKGE